MRVSKEIEECVLATLGDLEGVDEERECATHRGDERDVGGGRLT